MGNWQFSFVQSILINLFKRNRPIFTSLQRRSVTGWRHLAPTLTSSIMYTLHLFFWLKFNLGGSWQLKLTLTILVHSCLPCYPFACFLLICSYSLLCFLILVTPVLLLIFFSQNKLSCIRNRANTFVIVTVMLLDIFWQRRTWSDVITIFVQLITHSPEYNLSKTLSLTPQPFPNFN